MSYSRKQATQANMDEAATKRAAQRAAAIARHIPHSVN